MTSERRTAFFDRNQTDGRLRLLPTRTWGRHFCWMGLAVAALVAAGGCGKKTPAASALPQPAQPPAAAVQTEAQPNLPELNRSLLRWMMGHRHRPKDFEEFAATAGVTIPPPPAGKKYIIGKDMHIVLVDR